MSGGEIRKMALLVLLMALFVIACLVWMPEDSLAEETETVWILCQPDSYVTIRGGPGKKYSAEGRAYAGDDFQTDGKQKGGYLHMVRVPNELGEGWISLQYVSYDPPDIYENGETFTVNVKKVNCRMCIGGSRRGTLKRGAEVTVYLMSAEWAVTDRGYIQSKYLD